MKMISKFGKGQTLTVLEKNGFDFETKKNSFVKFTPLVGALLFALVVFFFASVLPVSAEECSVVDGVYQYSWTIHYTSIDKESAESTSGATEQYIVKCDKPFSIYAFNYYSTYSVSNKERTDTICEFFILPDGEASETGLQYSSDGGQTWKTYDYKTRQIGNGSSAYYVPCYFNSFYRIKSDNDTFYTVGASNMRSMHVEAWTDINGIISEVITGNKDAYQEETEGIEIDWENASKNNTFGLNNYIATVYDDMLTATWNGVSSRRVDISDYKNTYVRSCLTFCPIGSNGSNGIIVELPINTINDNGFTLNLSDYIPAIDYYLYSLESIPYYYSGDDVTNTLYAGVSSVYRWNEDGSLTSGDGPSGGVSSIAGVYDSDIGIISGLSIDKIGAFDCHGMSDGFSNCFSLSWDVTNFDTSTYIEYYEMKFQIQYSYALSTDGTLSYGNGIYSYSEDGSVLCVPSLDGAHSFCAHDFYFLTGLDDKLSLFDGSINRFNIHDLTKIYVRTVRQNKLTNDISYGDWAVITVTDWSNVLTGNRPAIGTTEIYAGGNNVNSDGTINGDVSDIIEPEESDKGFSFAGIDLSDITGIGNFFIGLVESLINIIGSFPSLFATIFGFLPFEIRNMIYVFLLVCVVAGLLKIFT